MKSLKIALAALVGLVAVSCYNDFDTPAPQKLYVDDDMAAMGLTRITIAEVKEKFEMCIRDRYRNGLGK